ncbi:MAG TPA: cation-translocating P-type ATPase [Bacteroidia bacterium]|jgi:Ca2+-transporting ATPase|nr:cation-translocating P-type ATPase [Bacteroidia bacterium]
MSVYDFHTKGLTNEEVAESRRHFGSNQSHFAEENYVWLAFKSVAKEPMVILLLAASSLYFISGKYGDGVFLAVAIALISAISLYQSTRSRNALEKLKKFTQPFCKVIRNADVEEIPREDLVIGDSLMMGEGELVAADGIIIHSNDFSLDESLLTGESLSVYKDSAKTDNKVFQGTMVSGGLGIAKIIAIGNDTKLGRIGTSLEEIQEEKTPLEQQINNFVKIMVMIGLVVFLIVWLLNYLRSHNILHSLLEALTLAMSILPEEIPVAFTTFMALGAWRLMKMGIVVKQMKTVETLGSATIICTDKTGTITENKMTLAKLFVLGSGKFSEPGTKMGPAEKDLVTIAMWASEPIPFDPMEIALHEAYSGIMSSDERQNYKLIHEYPLGGKPPMMTHIFENADGKRIIAAKGAIEALVQVCILSEAEKSVIGEAIKALSVSGFRLLGVGEADFGDSSFPNTQQEIKFQFKGIVAFYDPPKKNTKQVFEDFYRAGIDVKIVTGDNAATTLSIAAQVGLKGEKTCLTGDELMSLNDSDLLQKVRNTQIFTRMFPEAKLRIINALKADHQIVAMVGDGVNDAPALKAAHIGIAMGKKGAEIAHQSASLILANDNLSQMVEAVAMGRRIYHNLKKAIQYIISIHIPIILTVFIPLALGWKFPNIFSPVHILFLELIMGPTCSIIYENEPMEPNAMDQKPRLFAVTFFNWKELTTSILQGLAIAAMALTVYQYGSAGGLGESITRTMVFVQLISANIALTFVNRSFHYSILTTLKYKNDLVILITGSTIVLTALLLFVKPFIAFFEFASLNASQLAISSGLGLLSVIWYEGVKFAKRIAGKLNHE